jgi:hypothetical protein
MALASVALLVTTMCEPASAAEPRVDEEVVLCDLGVTRQLAVGNASFIIVYRLAIDDRGVVTEATKLKNDLLPDAKVSACLRRWTFRGAARKVTATLRWEHAAGWVSVVISDCGTTRRIRFEPHWLSRDN